MEEETLRKTAYTAHYAMGDVCGRYSGYKGLVAKQSGDNMHILRGKGKPITEVKRMRADAAYELLMAPARTVRQTSCGHLTAQA